MQYKTLFCAVASTLLLSACSNEIDSVKDGTLNGYPAISIGQTLDKFEGCTPKTQKWEFFETSNGKQVVQFTCQAKDLLNVSEAVLEEWANHPEMDKYKHEMDYENADYKFQFILNKNKDTFEVGYSGISIKWKDGSYFELPNDDDLYERFYENNPLMYGQLRYGDFLALRRLKYMASK